MDHKTLTNIIKFAPNENETWDFKEKWHESNGELLRDIINFANTPSHGDSYIIFGISDEDGSVHGVDKNDPNRKNKQQLDNRKRSLIQWEFQLKISWPLKYLILIHKVSLVHLEELRCLGWILLMSLQRQTPVYSHL